MEEARHLKREYDDHPDGRERLNDDDCERGRREEERSAVKSS